MAYKIISTCKGGGYLYCRTDPKHPKSNSKGLYPLHRVIAENKIGRELLPNEDVHHIDENKNNNDPNNLRVLTKSEHSKIHKKVEDLIKICDCCGKSYKIKPYNFNLRINRNKYGKVFCSRTCGTKYPHLIKKK